MNRVSFVHTFKENQLLQRVYIAESLVDGQLLVDTLNEHLIPAELFGQNNLGALGELPVTYPEVWIMRSTDSDRAQRVVEQFLSRPLPKGNSVCDNCGESNPNTFQICWLCHHSLDERV